MLFYIMILFQSFIWAGQTILFDESPIACQKNIAEKKCSLVLCGDKAKGWVGFIILNQRGSKDDINEFNKDTTKYEKRINKTSLLAIFKDKVGMLNLSGNLQYDNQTSQWFGHLEAQFSENLEYFDKRRFELRNLYENK